MGTIKKIKNYGDLARILLKYGRADNSEAYDSDEIQLEADRLVDSIEELGPTYIKLGQLLSTRKELFPEELLLALKSLQDDVSSIPSTQITTIIEDDFGVPLKKIFKHFDHDPLATASLGQVHLAQLHDGTDVVVKVQRPGVRKVVAKDIRSLGKIIDFLNKHSENFRRYHIQNILLEFEQNIKRELNYLEEANNLDRIKEDLADFDLLIFPNVYHSYCSQNVLTMDYIKGTKLTDISPLALTEIDGKSLSNTLFKAYLKQIFVDGFFHSDPHLGNLFYLEGNKLGVIDLGLVTRIGPEMRKKLLKLLINISEGRGEEAADTAWRMTSAIDGLDENIALFKEKISSLVKNQHDKSIENTETGRVLLEISRVAAESGFYFPQELSSISRTLIYLDEIGRILDPGFNPHMAIRENSLEIMRKSYKDEVSLSELFYDSIELKNTITGLPGKVNKLLEDLVNQRLRIKVDAIDQEHLMKGFQKVANRIASGLILAALIIGAAMLMPYKSSFTILGYPGFAIILFLIASLGSLGFLFEIFIRDE